MPVTRSKSKAAHARFESAAVEKVLARLTAAKSDSSSWSSPVHRGAVQLELLGTEAETPLPLIPVDDGNKLQTSDGSAKMLLPMSAIQFADNDSNGDGGGRMMVVHHSGRDLHAASAMKSAFSDDYYGPQRFSCFKWVCQWLGVITLVAIVAAIIIIVGSDIGYQYYHLHTQLQRRRPFTLNCNRPDYWLGLPADLVVLNQQFCDNESAWVQNCCFGEAFKLVSAEYAIRASVLAVRVLLASIGLLCFYVLIRSGCCERMLNGFSIEANACCTRLRIHKESNAAVAKSSAAYTH